MREQITALLSKAVYDAHGRDQNVLGVIFFGSRSRPDSHPYPPRPTSDVDIVYVYKGGDIGTMRILSRSIDDRLKPLGLREHPGNVILGEWINENTDRQTTSPTFSLLESTLRYLDEYSVAITVDPRVNQRIQTLIAHYGRNSTDRRLIEI